MTQLLFFCLVVALANLTYGDEARPNIFLIVADDLGYSGFGCYGGEIDRLDRRGKWQAPRVGLRGP